jgi:hypothetical protein
MGRGVVGQAGQVAIPLTLGNSRPGDSADSSGDTVNVGVPHPRRVVVTAGG